MEINGYEIIGELNNANSGFSKWGFVRKNGRVYFIKEMINPVYPMDETAMSAGMFAQRRNFCINYEERCRRLYNVINSASRGNLVRVIEFFRYGSKYYIVTERVENCAVSPKSIAGLPIVVKLSILKSIAFCFSCLHGAGIVHFDVKPSNIILKRTIKGGYAAKLIDFDSGFFKDELREDTELGGDLTYLAPEVFIQMTGEDVCVDENVDIFSLGLVFHEYFCGYLPSFDETEYDYPYEAVLDGGGVSPDFSVLPERLGRLIENMLDIDSSQRPSAGGIVNVLNEMICELVPERRSAVPEKVLEQRTADETVISSAYSAKTGKDDWFEMAGDL